MLGRAATLGRATIIGYVAVLDCLAGFGGVVMLELEEELDCTTGSACLTGFVLIVLSSGSFWESWGFCSLAGDCTSVSAYSCFSPIPKVSFISFCLCSSFKNEGSVFLFFLCLSMFLIIIPANISIINKPIMDGIEHSPCFLLHLSFGLLTLMVLYHTVYRHSIKTPILVIADAKYHQQSPIFFDYVFWFLIIASASIVSFSRFPSSLYFPSVSIFSRNFSSAASSLSDLRSFSEMQ